VGNSLLRPEEQNNFAHKISGKNWEKNQKSSFFSSKHQKAQVGMRSAPPLNHLLQGQLMALPVQLAS
jgi:hypothetical protein